MKLRHLMVIVNGSGSLFCGLCQEVGMDENRLLRLNADRVTWRRVGDELVVLDLVGSAYLSVNDTGAAVWDLLDGGAARADLVAALLEAFEVDEATAASDIDEFIADLAGRGLLVD
jgi:hypothetical protein